MNVFSVDHVVFAVIPLGGFFFPFVWVLSKGVPLCTAFPWFFKLDGYVPLWACGVRVCCVIWNLELSGALSGADGGVPEVGFRRCFGG